LLVRWVGQFCCCACVRVAFLGGERMGLGSVISKF